MSSTAESAQLPDVGDESWADRFQVAGGGDGDTRRKTTDQRTSSEPRLRSTPKDLD